MNPADIQLLPAKSHTAARHGGVVCFIHGVLLAVALLLVAACSFPAAAQGVDAGVSRAAGREQLRAGEIRAHDAGHVAAWSTHAVPHQFQLSGSRALRGIGAADPESSKAEAADAGEEDITKWPVVHIDGEEENVDYDGMDVLQECPPESLGTEMGAARRLQMFCYMCAPATCIACTLHAAAGAVPAGGHVVRVPGAATSTLHPPRVRTEQTVYMYVDLPSAPSGVHRRPRNLAPCTHRMHVCDHSGAPASAVLPDCQWQNMCTWVRVCLLQCMSARRSF